MTVTRQALRIAVCGIVLLGLVEATRADVIVFDGDTYAAIAYSPATGKFGYSYNFGSRATAEAAALKNCKGDDARVVTWVNNGWCALALGDDKARWGVGWSFGDGATNTYAKNRALSEINNRTTGGRVVLCVCSLNLEPERPSFKPFWPADKATAPPYQRAVAWIQEYGNFTPRSELYQKVVDQIEKDARDGNEAVFTFGAGLLQCDSPYQIHVKAGNFFCFALTEEQGRALNLERNTVLFAGGKRPDAAGPQVVVLKGLQIDGGRIGDGAKITGQVSCQVRQDPAAKLVVRLSYRVGKNSVSKFYHLDGALPADGNPLRFHFDADKDDDNFRGPVAAFVDVGTVQQVGTNVEYKRYSNSTGVIVRFGAK